MKKVIKWVSLITAGVLVFFLLALLIVPMFVDLQDYKPLIESKVSEATGRPLTLGGDLELSLFPWAGVGLSDLRLGGPPGFKEKDFITIESFEFQVKLLPLLFKNIQVKQFVLIGPRIVLEKAKDGRTNWEGLGKAGTELPGEPEANKKVPKEKGEGDLPIESLAVETFTIRDGTIVWIDHGQGERLEFSKLRLNVDGISLERPMAVSLAGLAEGNAVSLQGNIGPLGKKPGEGEMALDVSARVAETVTAKVQGGVTDVATRLGYNLDVQVDPFSPRKLAAAFGKELPLTPADPDVLKHLSLKSSLQGSAQTLKVKDGVLTLDDSKVKLSAVVKEFSKPNVTFDLDVDQIDLDRYLPASQGKPAKSGKAEEPVRNTDYTPLRKLVVEGKVHLGKLKVANARVQDVDLEVKGRNGVVDLDPVSLRLYAGTAKSKATLDVRSGTPATKVTLEMNRIEVNPLLTDLINKDFLEGKMRGQVALAMRGDSGETIKKTLSGTGELHLNDGAVVGVDLAGMVRNIKSAFGLQVERGQRPKTDFAELDVVFTLTNGLFQTQDATLKNPFLRLAAKGAANLVDETLNFRVQPKFVTTMEGQGGKMSQSGLVVPVLVGGTFSSPRFRPDLEAIIKKGLEKELPGAAELEKILPGQGKKGDEPTSLEKKAREFLKELPFGK
jgi:AsmA protein